MSKIDTINSKSNLTCIADELFTELTPEAAEVIQGGHEGDGYHFTAYGYDDNGNYKILAQANEYIKYPVYDNKYTDIYITDDKWRVYDNEGFQGTYIELEKGYHNLEDYSWYDASESRVESLYKNVGSFKSV